jgi:cathepsin F/cysteine peptidase B
MKLAIVLALVGVALAAAAVHRSLDDDKRLFEDFKQTYGKKYLPSEEAHRFECFRKNLNVIDERNARGAETHGVNMFTDLCADEFRKMYLGYRPHNDTRKEVPSMFTKEQLAGACASIDWRTKGVVTPVKNQGQCGSCWSFSSTGNMEGQWALSGHGLVSLSEEELVQCSSSAGNMGCNGGIMDDAFTWVIQNGGIDSEANYPYTSGGGYTGQCNSGLLGNVVAKFASYNNLPNSEQQMAAWMCTGGPLSIAVDALPWQTYTGGIMTNCPAGQLDHGVLIVGFDSTFSTPYWIIKNSWSASWGENGYIRVQMWTNQCGLDEDPCTIVA